ncbi:hypothetical protein HYALB_00012066 [Hymenoscyphus albidus]|uniref:Uncharacterized protein n=1 Tax=Hymenoscyphus albidus TaxID=595503 RepID=A0A9N9LM08_9HELO|nr:hypothetical protein HYALB_00012066 [Hymenoscyphus albidus]
MTGRNPSDINVVNSPKWKGFLDCKSEVEYSGNTRQSTREASSDEGDEYQESYEERLERWKAFFKQQPLGRCLDAGEEDALMGELLYERLLEEVRDLYQVGTDVSNVKVLGDRTELSTRAFWTRIRNELWIDDDEIYHEWADAEEIYHYWPWVDRDDESIVGLHNLQLGRHINRWWKPENPPKVKKPKEPKRLRKHTILRIGI